MISFGYKLSSEEHGPVELVRYARRAEEAGFALAAISDHYHPWIDRQGHSPFVWNVIGAISQVTQRLAVLTAVTAPTIRIHPAIVAQAAATSAIMLPGRFLFGVGSGENLNEHVLGDRWPPAALRIEMLEEAIEVMRKLWDGGLVTHRGRFYTVENARLYSLPDEPPPVMVAAGGKKSATLAGRVGDGVVSAGPQKVVVETFERAGGRGKPRFAEVNVCWASSEEEAKRTAHEWWPVAGLKGQLMQELALPSHFESAAEMVPAEALDETIALGPDPEVHIAEIKKFIEAGYDHVWVHQIGPDQDGFFTFYEDQVLPKIA